MFVHAQDVDQGIIVSRHTADGTLRDSVTEATRVLAAFHEAPCSHTPKLHLLVIDPGAPLPSMSERASLAQLAGQATVPRWVACVIPSRQARLILDIVLTLAPKRAGRRIQAFNSTTGALAWLLTLRPEALARCSELLREVDKKVLATTAPKL